MEPRCLVTRNPLGTDTWSAGNPCRCSNCQSWLAGLASASSRAQAAEARARWAEAKLAELQCAVYEHIDGETASNRIASAIFAPDPVAAALVSMEEFVRGLADHPEAREYSEKEAAWVYDLARKTAQAHVANIDRARGGR